MGGKVEASGPSMLERTGNFLTKGASLAGSWVCSAWGRGVVVPIGMEVIKTCMMSRCIDNSETDSYFSWGMQKYNNSKCWVTATTASGMAEPYLAMGGYVLGTAVGYILIRAATKVGVATTRKIGEAVSSFFSSKEVPVKAKDTPHIDPRLKEILIRRPLHVTVPTKKDGDEPQPEKISSSRIIGARTPTAAKPSKKIHVIEKRSDLLITRIQSLNGSGGLVAEIA